MTALKQLTTEEMRALCEVTLRKVGYAEPHVQAITRMLTLCQMDDCQSHGLFRLIMCHASMASGQVDGAAVPRVSAEDGAVVRVDANNGISLLAAQEGMPHLIEAARKYGIAAMAINRCYHFSALWPEVEQLAAAGLAGLSMLPSQAWVAPAGGTRGSLGTNPIAFSWPRPGGVPFTFDFATSGFARGEIELYRRAGKPLPEGVALDANGAPTTDPEAALKGAMLTFGGYKGSALSIMVELMAGPLIDDLTSLESLAHANARPGAPYHGQIIMAFDPGKFSGGRISSGAERAERLFDDITSQGARLPSQRRHAARARNAERGYAEITQQLYDELTALTNSAG